MFIKLYDRATFQTSRREITDQGYLRVPGRIARTGIQQYTAAELELTDRAPTDIINVYRPPEEVFSADSLATYKDADVTVTHLGMVDAATFKDYSAGHVSGDAYKSGEWVEATLVFKDADAIKAIDEGTAELSAGYTAEYIPEKGVTPDGQTYDYIQRNIKINHVALVDKARAGNEARIYDDGGGKPMFQVTLDGTTVAVPDQPTQQLIQKAFADATKRVTDAEKTAEMLKDERSELAAKLDAKDEELEKLKSETSDSVLAEKLKTLDSVRQSAHKISGGKVTIDSLDPMAYKVAALKVVRPTKDWDALAKNDPKYVSVAYDMAEEAKEAEDEEEEEKARQTGDSFKAFGQDVQKAASKATQDANPQATVDAAYQAKQQRKAAAWKEKTGA